MHLDTIPIRAAWVKGHSHNKGNDLADSLARSATLHFDPYPGASYSYLSLYLSSAAHTEWLEWLRSHSHFYSRNPRRTPRRLRGLSRLDSSVLFRLRSHEGWLAHRRGSPEEDVRTCLRGFAFICLVFSFVFLVFVFCLVGSPPRLQLAVRDRSGFVGLSLPYG